MNGLLAWQYTQIIIFTGVVSFLDPKSNTNKTVLFLNRGDSFGEQAIMTRTLRQTTVISREKIELLVMSDEVNGFEFYMISCPLFSFIYL